jgi:tetratricopeptide (TPR) repeat protein
MRGTGFEGTEEDAMSQILTPGWRGSPAHIFLLGSFLRPGKVEELTTLVEWEPVLGEAPERVIEGFLAAGLLEFADQGQPLARRLGQVTVKELQEMLRERGLPVSGRKADLISRLVEADPEGMEEAARALSALRCTEQGRAVVGELLATGKVKTPPGIADVEPSEPGEVDSLTAEEHVDRGCTYGSQGNYGQALSEFNRAVELNPAYALAYHWRGVAYERLGDYPRALIEFHQAIALDPEQAEFYVGRGDAYRKLGDYEMAIREYDVAIARDPQLAAAYHNRGVAHEHLKDYQQALGDYGKAAELGPGSAEPHFGLGVAYAQAGDYQRAAEHFEHAIRLTDDAQLLAWAKERLGSVQMFL